MPAHCSTSRPLVITGTADEIRDLICGPLQHNEHCKGWRWNIYLQDAKRGMANVDAELRQMHAARRAWLASRQENV